MLSYIFVLSIWTHLGLMEKCNAVAPGILPAIMDEFKIYQPIIFADDSTLKNKMIEFVKNLSYHGHSMGFGQKQFNQYQSCIILTDDLIQFKWKNPTYAPILVVSNIQSEGNLKEVDVSIGSEVLFLDWLSLKVYESYTINKMQITRYLGQIQANNRSKASAKFVPSIDYISNMENRRCDFYGLQLFGAVSWMSEDPENYSNLVQFFPNNDTYDVTKLVNDPKYHGMFWYSLDMKILKTMESTFNFTSKLFLRKDMKFGAPYISSNGSTIITEGVFQYLIEDSLEFVWESFVMLNIRSQFVDFLYTITTEHDAIFVPIEDTYEEIDWSVFVKPLATGVWIAIIIKCVIFSTLASFIDWFNDFKLVSRL